MDAVVVICQTTGLFSIKGADLKRRFEVSQTFYKSRGCFKLMTDPVLKWFISYQGTSKVESTTTLVTSDRLVSSYD